MNETDKNQLLQLLDRFSPEGKAARKAEIQAQSDEWRRQKLCPHCGGKIGLFGSCKVCKKSPATPIQMPTDESIEAYIGADCKVYIRFGGISWLALNIQNGKVWLLSEKIIEERAYHVTNTWVTWERCTLREYLNGDFYNRLGPVKSMIASTRNVTQNEICHISGSTTTEKIFLLDIKEVRFCTDAKCYAIAKNEFGVASWWWLRSPGSHGNGTVAASIDPNGAVNNGLVAHDSRNVSSVLGVRPSLWLNL